MARQSRQTTQRPRGRPGAGETADVRSDILNTAEELFATQGFAPTSVREIARQVGVNPAMVHYYFGSKKKLLRAVMERVLEPLAASVQTLSQRDSFDVAAYIAPLFEVMSEHPFLPQLIAREVFLSGGEMHQQFVENFAPRLGGRLPGILEHEQLKGRMSVQLRPNVTAMLILSMCFFPFIARPVTEKTLKISYDRDGLASISKHIHQILKQGIGQ